MIKADKYLKDTIRKIIEEGSVDENPRAKVDGKPAHSKYITQQVFQYDISKGEFPITTLRTTALKGAFYDIEAIYIKQTNVLEEMHPSIHSWWKDFCYGQKYVVKTNQYPTAFSVDSEIIYQFSEDEVVRKYNVLGQTYGHTIKRYDLMNKLLKGLEENPFGRRHSINLNQEQERIEDPQALPPCAFETLWTVRDGYIDLTLIQRSHDFLTVFSLNSSQYVMLGMMVCGHLTHKTGKKYKLSNFYIYLL